MQDVRNLYYIQLIIWMLSIFVLCLGYTPENMIIPSVSVLASLCVLLVFILIDFESFWMFFHKLIFTNDLWLMDSRTDKIVRVFDQDFFIKLNLIISISISIFSLIIGGISWIAKTKTKI